jgi:hypothetical protein
VTIRDLLVAVFPYLFYGLILLATGALAFVVVLSIRHRRRSSIVQVGRLVLTVIALVAVGVLAGPMAIDWVAVVFGVASGLGVAWWYGRHTVREASLGVNVALIVLVASLMTVSVVIPDWLDPRSFLISGSLVGIRLLVATSPQTRLVVPSRRRGDRAMRLATIWMLLLAASAAFFLAAAVAGADVFGETASGL